MENTTTNTGTLPEEKKYLKWYNKLGYGSGDAAACLTYALVTQFVMIYLTDSVGLNSAIIGSLILLSKVLDGITDIIFGHLIDKTHTKMGKARPWMFFAQFGVSFCVVMLFSIPHGIGSTSQYAWFFLSYTCMNAIFYTANNIAYASLTALITKNSNERVQVGVIRFCFSLGTNLFVAYATVYLSPIIGWSRIALFYTIAAIIINTISVFSVRELPPDELLDRSAEKERKSADKVGLWESIKISFTNRYFVALIFNYLIMYTAMGFGGIAIYYFTYIMHNTHNYSTYSSMYYLPMIFGLIFTPMLVKKFSMYKVNLAGYGVHLAACILFAAAGFAQNFPLMLIAMFIRGIGQGPLIGDQNALIALASDYSYRKTGKRVDGMMYSCSSMGNKLGTGIGTAVYGVLLSSGGFVPNAAQQTASCISMINFLFLIIPIIFAVLMIIDLKMLNIEKAVHDWDEAHPENEAVNA
jgi:GPH family glycoside/pentoside/hexuronide:cation symporter